MQMFLELSLLVIMCWCVYILIRGGDTRGYVYIEEQTEGMNKHAKRRRKLRDSHMGGVHRFYNLIKFLHYNKKKIDEAFVLKYRKNNINTCMMHYYIIRHPQMGISLHQWVLNTVKP